MEGGTRHGQWTWALYEAFQCRNLYRRHGEAYPWAVRDARERLRAIAPAFPPVVVLLGRRVAAAAWIDPTFAWGTWLGRDGYSVAALPHPSGRNLLYNDAETRDLAGRTLREAIERARRA